MFDRRLILVKWFAGEEGLVGVEGREFYVAELGSPATFSKFIFNPFVYGSVSGALNKRVKDAQLLDVCRLKSAGEKVLRYSFFH